MSLCRKHFDKARLLVINLVAVGVNAKTVPLCNVDRDFD